MLTSHRQKREYHWLLNAVKTELIRIDYMHSMHFVSSTFLPFFDHQYELLLATTFYIFLVLCSVQCTELLYYYSIDTPQINRVCDGYVSVSLVSDTDTYDCTNYIFLIIIDIDIDVSISVFVSYSMSVSVSMSVFHNYFVHKCRIEHPWNLKGLVKYKQVKCSYIMHKCLSNQ
jgi:hypothetical protein